MTASNVDFFPCRVKLLGVTYSSTVATANTSSNTTVTKLQKIRRNLFGSPDPSDMKAVYQKEDQRMRAYVLQRYNLDTKALQSTSDQKFIQHPTDKSHSQQNTNIPMQPTQSLIHQELVEHDESLNSEKYSLHTPILESMQKKRELLSHQNCSKIACRCNGSKNIMLTEYKHKQKCRRQLSLKKRFKIRKNLVCMKNSS